MSIMSETVDLSMRQICDQLVQQLSDMIPIFAHQIQTLRRVSDEDREVQKQYDSLIIRKIKEKQLNNNKTVATGATGADENDSEPEDTEALAVELMDIDVHYRQSIEQMANNYDLMNEQNAKVMVLYKERVRLTAEKEDLVRKFGKDLSDVTQEDLDNEWNQLIDNLKNRINKLQKNMDDVCEDIDDERQSSHQFGDIIVKNT
ncbi:uncharacterized protein LOC128956175 [Oppia nitens]|uniref:uncharacterized protein LOC128956175 n=1 Tax=Oppia nitens TaxID=1686743 RepID=UPI0023DC2C61|nr:uncharacterized protein LOC128956175 [Oppia nitens]